MFAHRTPKVARDLVEFVTAGLPAIRPGGVVVEAEGHLTRRDIPSHREIAFSFRGIPLTVRIETTDGRSTVVFDGCIGTVPYSFRDPLARVNTVAIILAAQRSCGTRLCLGRDQRIFLTDRTTVDVPVTPLLVVTAAARLLVPLAPYLDLLQVMVPPPPAPPALAAPGSLSRPAAR